MDLLDIQVHGLDPIVSQQESSPKNRREGWQQRVSEPPCLVHHGPREFVCPGDQFNPVRLGTLCWPSVAASQRTPLGWAGQVSQGWRIHSVTSPIMQNVGAMSV